MLKFVVLAILSLLLPGCGIILFPVSIPLAISENRVRELHMRVTDERGEPLEKATAVLTKRVRIPNYHVTGLEAILLTWIQDSDSTTALRGGRLDLAPWCESYSVRISAEGYYPRMLSYSPYSPWGLSEMLSTDVRDYGFPNTRVPIKERTMSLVLERKENPQTLIKEYVDLSETKDGLFHCAVFDGGNTTERNVSPPAQPFPRNCLYMSVARTEDGSFARNGVGSIKSLQSMKLHTTFENGGFIRIPVENGRPVGGRVRHAPVEGYQPELMLSAADIAQPRVLFYFKSDRFYGVGNIDYFTDFGRSPGNSAESKEWVNLHLEIFLQPDGSTNVE